MLKATETFGVAKGFKVHKGCKVYPACITNNRQYHRNKTHGARFFTSYIIFTGDFEVFV